MLMFNMSSSITSTLLKLLNYIKAQLITLALQVLLIFILNYCAECLFFVCFLFRLAPENQAHLFNFCFPDYNFWRVLFFMSFTIIEHHKAG